MQILVFTMIGVFIVLFIVCAVFFPELVGIAGAKAKEIEESHHKGDDPPPSV